MVVALTIAGSDSGGGAGLQADLKTFEAHGVFGTSVVTALTAQNTLGVQAVEYPRADMVAAQLAAVLADFPVAALKVGMAGTADGIRRLVAGLAPLSIPRVVDPVMVASSGDSLLASDAQAVLEAHLLPLATVLTPNIPEAASLLARPLGPEADLRAAVLALSARFPQAAILLKGGHRPLGTEGQREIEDWLLLPGASPEAFRYPFLETRSTHGTGCTLSAALTAQLALGQDIRAAYLAARAYLQQALVHAPGLGAGTGPLRHHLPADIRAAIGL